MREITLTRDEFADMSGQILGQGGSFCFKARGFSMIPFIRNEDVLAVTPRNPSELKTGDVILYRSDDNRSIAHRIVRKKNRDNRGMLFMRGDSLYLGDGWIQSTHVLGHVESLKRGGKMIPLNRGASNCLAQFWVKIHPVGPLAVTLASKLKKIISFFLHSV